MAGHKCFVVYSSLLFASSMRIPPCLFLQVSFGFSQASANCDAAKTSLENICKHFSEELYEFDILKETELKDILVDFADGKFQDYEKVSKIDVISLPLVLI